MRVRGKDVSCNGFTLLELLVVMGIVAILAAMTFPLVDRVRQSGNEVKTLSNMRQMGIALLTYTGEHNYDLPSRVAPAQDGGTQADKWPRALQPYVQNLAIYSSPIPNLGAKSYKVTNEQDYFNNTQNYTSYIYNGGNDVAPLDSGQAYPRLNIIGEPSATILLGIPVPQSTQFYMDFAEADGNNNSVLNKSAFPDGSTYVFCDGSARNLVVDSKLVGDQNKQRPVSSGTYTDWLWLFDKNRAEVIQ